MALHLRRNFKYKNATKPPSERFVTAGVVNDHHPYTKIFYITIFNVRSLLNEARIIELEYAISKINWNMVIIAWVREKFVN